MPGISSGSNTALRKALLVAAVVPDVPVLRRPLRPPHRLRSPRAVRPDGPGARRDVVHPRGHLLLVPAADHRPRRVHHGGRGSSSDRRHRLARRLRVAQRARVGPRERLLLVGTSAGGRRPGARAVRAARTSSASRSSASSIRIRRASARRCINPGVIGTIDDIPAIVRARTVDRVVVSLADARGKLPMDKLLEMKLDGVSFDHLASVYEEYTGKIAVENLRPSWLIFSTGSARRRAADGRQARCSTSSSRVVGAGARRCRSCCSSRSPSS